MQNFAGNKSISPATEYINVVDITAEQIDNGLYDIY